MRVPLALIGPVEPETASTLTRALEAGHPVDTEAGGLAADVLTPNRVRALMYPFAQKYLELVVLVPNRAIEAAQQALWDVLRVVTEPVGGKIRSPSLREISFRRR
jgi:threonine dehydratase